MKIQSGRIFGWLIVCMLGVAAIVPVSRNNQAINASSQLHTVANAPDVVTNRQTFKAIDQLQVGQRVLTGFNSDSDRRTSVDPSTWKKLRLAAEYCWTDGTRDTFQVVTLQSPQWLDRYSVTVGAQVPMPLDVQEMGCPDGLMATVESIESCPQIQDSPGRVILTTVSHLNAACRTLSVQDQAGYTETIETTDYHPFWSETKQGWVTASHLNVGDRLLGDQNQPITLVASIRLPGIHWVYNLTVELDHVYRVGQCGVLVHNNCYDEALDLQSARGGEIQRIMGETNRLGKPTAIPIPPKYELAPDETIFSHAVNVIDGKVFDKMNPEGVPYDDYIAELDKVSREMKLSYTIGPWTAGMPQ